MPTIMCVQIVHGVVAVQDDVPCAVCGQLFQQGDTAWGCKITKVIQRIKEIQNYYS